jgi:hypothetical protein
MYNNHTQPSNYSEHYGNSRMYSTSSKLVYNNKDNIPSLTESLYQNKFNQQKIYQKNNKDNVPETDAIVSSPNSVEDEMMQKK